MTDSDIQRIQETLGIQLPKVYVDLMLEFPEELKHWPAWENQAHLMFFSDVDMIIDLNMRVRNQPSQFVKFPREYRTSWPNHLFLFGQSTSESLHLINVRRRNPAVESISLNAVRASFPDVATLFGSFKYQHSESWKQDKIRSTQPPVVPKARITFAELMEEARTLVRPAVVLSNEGEEYVGYWRGAGVVRPPPGIWEHWISFDPSVIPNNPQHRTGVISVYLCLEDSDRYHDVAVVHDGAVSLPHDAEGEKLYAHRIECLPPMDAVFWFGSEKVQKWLSANDWNPALGYYNFPDREPIDAYERNFRSEHPFLHDEEFFAMLGGWSVMFDESWYELVEKPLMLLTIRDSEPWLEVFEDGNELRGYSRIT
ncbi:MAG: SMI1/KNR4 family protein [Fimbriiglobus sp.]